MAFFIYEIYEVHCHPPGETISIAIVR